MATIESIRRDNLHILRFEYQSIANLANVIKRSPSQVSQWLNSAIDSETTKRRTISSNLARHVEEHCDKAEGWLDISRLDDPQYNNLNLNLNRLMYLNEVSEGKLAEASGVTQPTIHRIRAGKTKTTSDDVIRLLSTFFKVSPAQLRGEVAAPKSAGKVDEYSGNKRFSVDGEDISEVSKSIVDLLETLTHSDVMSIKRHIQGLSLLYKGKKRR